MRKTMILSYDYELFFGDCSGTVRKTLIEPTDLLLNQFEKSHLKATFFIDYLMIKRLAQNTDERSRTDLELIERQIKDIVRRGHRIELHIHPHWVDALYNGDGTWDFSDFSRYSLNRFTEDEVVEMFVEGCATLHAIVRTIDPDYQIIVFRAGGWAVQPFSLLKKAFLIAGIRIDSSVSYGIKNTNKDSAYDFTNAPRKDIYRFEEAVETENCQGNFIEVPISSYYRLMFYKLVDRIFKRFSSKMLNMADGTHSREKEKVVVRWHFFNRSMLTMTCVSTATALMSVLFSRKKLLVCIDHPKDFTKGTLDSLRLVGKFVHSITYRDLLEE